MLKHKGKILLLAIIVLATMLARSPKDLKASWYSIQCLKDEGTWDITHGRCADGSMFNDSQLTCACRIYPLGSWLRVRNKENGKSCTVRVTDRISKRFAKTRIDLSKAAFAQIADLKQGIVPVTVEKMLWVKKRR